jgi:hypothetical protein
MKNIYTFLLCISVSLGAFAQGNISSFTVLPPDPTTNDTVLVIVEEWFSSGGCPIDFISHNVNGNTISANSHHCLGLLTVICNGSDTFKIDPLPAGTYDFNLTLTTGALPAPCTPGIVADDMGTTSFSVSQAVGIPEFDVHQLSLKNPVSGELVFGKPIPESLQLFDITGKLVMAIKIGSTSADLSKMTTGIYFLRSSASVRKLVIQ